LLRKIVAISLSTALVLTLSSSQADAGASKLKKDESTVSLRINKWTDVPFSSGNSFKVNGERTLWVSQLHMQCKKKPRYVKMRLARHLPNGKLDTTGTTTYAYPKGVKVWQGTLLWETKSKHPMTVQYKIMGGSKCTSSSRQFKWWQPGEPFPEEVPTDVTQ
jgi:hypothetical protein